MKIKNKSLSLIELLISIVIMSVVILGIYSAIIFSSNQLISSSRKSKVQTDLALALEHISKYVQLGSGSKNNPAITLITNGFQVITDGAVISYSLTDNILSASCSGSACSFTTENLSSKIISGGFNVNISSFGSIVDIILTGRYWPTSDKPISPSNPQIEMKTRIICNSCSTN